MKDDLDIKEIFSDIREEYDNNYASSKYNVDPLSKGNSSKWHWGRRKNVVPHSSVAFWKTYLPNVLGFLLGCEFFRLCGGSGFGYVLCGFMGSVIIGMIDSMIMKKMELTPALIRNLIMTLMLSGVTTIIFIIVLTQELME